MKRRYVVELDTSTPYPEKLLAAIRKELRQRIGSDVTVTEVTVVKPPLPPLDRIDPHLLPGG